MEHPEPDMKWTVRPGRRADCVPVWHLVEELASFEKLGDMLEGSADAVERWLFDESVASLLVAEAREADDPPQVVGYAIFFPTLATFKMRPGLWLEDVYVRENCRGKGIGKALLANVIAIAKEKGYARVDWAVLDWNVDAVNFYRSMGAQVFDEWRICRIDT